jgi:hypothetical protein
MTTDVHDTTQLDDPLKPNFRSNTLVIGKEEP